MPLRSTLLVALVVALALGAAAGCVPYAVGTTAETVRPGVLAQSATFQFARNQPDLGADEGEDARRMTTTLDNEVRFGLDARSDAGVRLAGTSGVVVSYRRRLSDAGPFGARVAGIAGAGVLNLGSHFHVEGTLVASAPEGGAFTPYGGVRAQALAPFGAEARPPGAVGVFGGVRIARGELAIHPELGVFYSPSDRLDQSDWIVVPSLTVHGDGLLKALGVGL